MEATPAAAPSPAKMALATVGGVLLGLAAGAWLLVGLFFAWLLASADFVVWAWVSLVVAVGGPLALFFAWMRWGPCWRPLRRVHWICRRVFGLPTGANRR
jgi:hypothetical protein